MFESGIPVYSIPLNVTHKAIFHKDAVRYLLDPSSPPASSADPLPPAVTPLRHSLSTLLTFFAQTYLEVFGFTEGPPVHDALVVAYIARPEAFTSQLCRVDAERFGEFTRGTLVVDPFERSVPRIKNVEIARTIKVGWPDRAEPTITAS